MPARTRPSIRKIAAWCLLPAVLLTQGIAMWQSLRGRARFADGLWLAEGCQVSDAHFVVGWPCDCYAYSSTTGFPGYPGKGPIVGAVDLKRSFGRGTALIPTHPLWSGFAGNVILLDITFAGGFVAASAFVLRVRDRDRKALGRCVTCGYDRKGLPPTSTCPECGELPL